MAVEVGTNARTSSPGREGSEAGSIRGPATTIIRSSGRALRLRERLDHPPQQRAADARAADRDDADALVRAVAELAAALAVAELPPGRTR